jgi:aubergine-like protein
MIYFSQFLNVIVRKAMEKMDLKLVNRNYFDPKSAIVLDDLKLEIWPGYVTTIRQHEHELLLNVDVACKILRSVGMKFN